MVYTNSILEVADNSGALYVKCVNTGRGRGGAKLGDLIRVFVYKKVNWKDNRKDNKTERDNPVKRGRLLRAVVIGNKKKITRFNGVYLKSQRTRVLLVSPALNFLGTRIYGPVCKEIRNQVYRKEGTYRSKIESKARGTI